MLMPLLSIWVKLMSVMRGSLIYFDLSLTKAC
jgi:hypothetical protein